MECCVHNLDCLIWLSDMGEAALQRVKWTNEQWKDCHRTNCCTNYTVEVVEKLWNLFGKYVYKPCTAHWNPQNNTAWHSLKKGFTLGKCVFQISELCLMRNTEKLKSWKLQYWGTFYTLNAILFHVWLRYLANDIWTINMFFSIGVMYLLIDHILMRGVNEAHHKIRVVFFFLLTNI